MNDEHEINFSTDGNSADSGRYYSEPREEKKERTCVYVPPVQQESGAKAAPSPSAPPPKKKKSYTGVIIAVVIVVCLLMTVVFSALAFFIGMAVADVEGDETEQHFETGPASIPNVGLSGLTDPDVTLSAGDSDEIYSMTAVAAKTVDTVVEIRTDYVVEGSFMQQYISQGAGSGVIITENGYIATNNHVIDEATKITVILRNGEEYDAALVGTDEKTDLAVVKIEKTGLPVATIGNSDKLEVAEAVLAIGNPLGELGGSVSNGIISALSRKIMVENQEMTLLQTTAAVNPGNSGGGLFNMSGELIGIVNAKSSGEDIEGIGFAIPSDIAKPVIEDIIKFGYVKGRVLLGVTTIDILDQYTAMQYRVDRLGVYVYSVGKGSDAEKAGLKSGDLLLSLDGVEIENQDQFSSLIQNHSVGDTISITVYRQGKDVTLSVTLTEYIPGKVTFDD